MNDRCTCGREATTETQTGWNPAANSGAGGGVYEPLCDACWQESAEGRQCQREAALRSLGRRGYVPPDEADRLLRG